MTIRLRRLYSCLALCSGLIACDKASDSSNDEAPAASQPAEEAKPTEPEARDRRKDKEKQDRGDASMKIGGFEWKAEKASFRLAEPRLTIRASANQITEGKASRQELHLQIDDYRGPGSYTTPIAGSRFIGVGLDTAAAEAAAKTGDDAQVEVIGKALSQADHLMLSNAKITIESASETEIVGSFSWTPPSTIEAPEITDGKFRAIVQPSK